MAPYLASLIIGRLSLYMISDIERKEPNSWRVKEESEVDTKTRDLSTTAASHALESEIFAFGKLGKANSHLGRAWSLVK